MDGGNSATLQVPGATKTGTLKVPSASIYYEMHGSGPILLMISGGSGDAGSYNKIMNYLTNEYTVVIYDRRGYTRSKIEDEAQGLKFTEESDDVHYLLAALTNKPAYVFGSSIGADIALDFATRYPEQVREVIAHEPPVNYLTKDHAKPPVQQTIQQILATKGVDAGMKEIAKIVGVDTSNIGTVMTSESKVNATFFLQTEFPALAKYRFDFDAVKASMNKTKFVIGIGQASPKDSMGYLGALAISDKTGIPKVEFPGDHAGMSSYPKEFADIILGILGGNLGN